jgi:hypothetical protein
MRMLHETEELHSESGHGHKSVLKLDIEHCKIMNCVLCCVIYVYVCVCQVYLAPGSAK